MEQLSWRFDRLKSLREVLGLTVDEVCEKTGLGTASLRNYERGRTEPSLHALVTLSDYYQVPIDYLLGRANIPEDLKDYRTYFNRVERWSYETYLHRRTSSSVDSYGNMAAPWPYNLMDEVNGEPYGMIITRDQEKGIEEALETLPERRKTAVLLYYKEGLKLEEAGKRLGITRERFRQILAHAVRILRHPSRKNLILYGSELSRIKQEERSIEVEMSFLQARKAALEQLTSEVREMENLAPKGLVEKYDLINMPIAELELSVRSFNCLTHAKLTTVGQVYKMVCEGELKNIRNLGRKSADEIIAKLQCMGLEVNMM